MFLWQQMWMQFCSGRFESREYTTLPTQEKFVGRFNLVELYSDVCLPSCFHLASIFLFLRNIAFWWQTCKTSTSGRLTRVCCCQTFVDMDLLHRRRTDWKKCGDCHHSLATTKTDSLQLLFFYTSCHLAKDMQKFNSTGTHSNTLPRDAELQLRLADSGGAGDGKENGAGKHFLTQPEEESSFCTKRKMLVGLDVICLCVGKNMCIYSF